MSADLNVQDAEPSSSEYSTAWVAYALQATGVFGFVLGPLAGLIVSYARRDAEGAGFVASHHRWLIATFWWTLLGYLVCLGVIFAGAWPIISEVIREAIRAGGHVREFSLGIAWESIFATVGAAMLGGLGMLAVWIWNLYRIVRGGLRLANRSPAP
ncbi:MAG: hypothetical protein JSW31_17845 [Burkholderiales bacterium]|jgi:uncharacterized membrane protein|nr:MAG: hypothetical protein JSW31_17845 [Burkholderiales bacterium]